MKKKGSLIFGACLACALALACGRSEWVAKVDGKTITLDELNTYYYAQQKSLYNLSKEKIDELAADPAQVAKNPTLNKAEFLEQLVRQMLVYNKALEDKVMKDKELEALVQMAREAVVVGYYVREKFKNEIEPAPKEIEELYMKEKGRLQGVPAEQAEMFIKQQLQQQKLQVKIRELVESLRDEGKVQKNTKLLKEEEKKLEKKAEAKPEEKAKK